MSVPAPVWKMVFMALVGPVFDYSLSPPQPPPTSKELLKPPESLTTRFPRISAALSKVIIRGWTLAEIILPFAATDTCPPSLSKYIIKLLVHSQQPKDAIARVSVLTPTFFIGGCMIIAGSLLRVACYKALGRFFTYELSIRNQHKLITSGLYAFVRHPSYTGALCFSLGQYLCVFEESSWLVACSGLFPRDEYVRKCLVWGIRVVLCSTLAVYVHRRMNEEDAMLIKLCLGCIESGVTWLGFALPTSSDICSVIYLILRIVNFISNFLLVVVDVGEPSDPTAGSCNQSPHT